MEAVIERRIEEMKCCEKNENREAIAALTSSIKELLQRKREKLTVAIQDKNGRLYTAAWELLELCMSAVGITVTEEMRLERLANEALVYESQFVPRLKIASVRQKDMPRLIRNYGIDFAVMGGDELDGNNQGLVGYPLGKGKSSLFVGVPADSDIAVPADLEGKVIATSYAGALKDYLRLQGINAKTISLSGKVETAVSLGIAGAVCDLVETGRTMRENGLRPLIKIKTFQAMLVRKISISEASPVVERMRVGGYVGEGFGAPEARIIRTR